MFTARPRKLSFRQNYGRGLRRGFGGKPPEALDRCEEVGGMLMVQVFNEDIDFVTYGKC